MGRIVTFLPLLLLIHHSHGINPPASSSDPMIATATPPSNSLLQYYNNNHWLPDNTTTTLIDKLDALKQCQRLYPKLDITNIVETTATKPNQVCKSVSNCYHDDSITFTVYRCLVAPFQSEALLVPSPCVFDHLHNQSNCYDSKQWNLTAFNSCKERDYNLKSFAVLLPCGVGLFTGVEFVCCPGKREEGELEYDSEEEDDEEEDYYYDSSSTTTSTTTTQQPIIDGYLKRKFDPLQEHATFRLAEQKLENLHRLRMSRVMRDWEELEKKYQNLHDNDPAKADEFKKSVTLRFQKTIKNLEEEGLAEKRQLVAVHQQRVLQHLTTRKKESMECFTSSLANNEENKVKKCLEKLMRILHKDRHHTIMHYRHLVRSEPGQAQVEQDYTLQRLEGISLMAREALNMLDRHALSEKLRPLIEDYVLGMMGREDGQESLLSATKESDKVLLKIATTTTTTVSSSTTTETSTMETEKVVEEEEDVDRVVAREQIISVRRETYDPQPTTTLYFTVGFAVITITAAILIGLAVLIKRGVVSGMRRDGFLEINQQMHHHNQLKSPEEKHVAAMQINGYINPTYSLLNGN